MTRHQVSGNSERTPGGADPTAHPRRSRPPPGNRTFHGFMTSDPSRPRFTFSVWLPRSSRSRFWRRSLKYSQSVASVMQPNSALQLTRPPPLRYGGRAAERGR